MPKSKINILNSLLESLFNLLLLSEREHFLNNNPEDIANGFYKHKLLISFGPIHLNVPRNRFLHFRPSILPKPYKHTLSQDYNNLIKSLILSAKSLNSLRFSLKNMDLPYSNEDIDSIVDEFADKLKELNSRELKSDWFAIYLDAKVLEVKNKNNIVKQGCLYTFVGVSLQGKKEILLSRFFYGNESIEKWKICFNDIKNRGVSRVLLFISDDFNGINKIISSFFPLF